MSSTGIGIFFVGIFQIWTYRSRRHPLTEGYGLRVRVKGP